MTTVKFMQDRSRAIFQSIKEDLTRRGMGNLTPSPSYLRVEQSITNAKNLYDFDIKKNGNEIATEKKLDRNDLFVLTDLGIFIGYQITAEIGKMIPQTYPNAVVFGDESSFDYTDLYTIYNGFYKLKVDSTVHIENEPLLQFLTVPETQKTAAVSSVSAIIDYSGFDFATAMKPTRTMINLHGTQDIQFSIEFPMWSGIQIAQTASGAVNKLIVMPYGFLVKGGAAGLR